MKILGIILGLAGIGLIVAGTAVNGFLNPNWFWLFYDVITGILAIYVGFMIYKLFNPLNK